MNKNTNKAAAGIKNKSDNTVIVNVCMLLLVSPLVLTIDTRYLYHLGSNYGIYLVMASTI